MNQPKWGHLKQLHELLMSMEEVLTYGDVKHTEYGHLTTVIISPLSLLKIVIWWVKELIMKFNNCNRQQVTPTRGNQVASLEMHKIVAKTSPLEMEPTLFLVGLLLFFLTV